MIGVEERQVADLDDTQMEARRSDVLKGHHQLAGEGILAKAADEDGDVIGHCVLHNSCNRYCYR